MPSPSVHCSEGILWHVLTTPMKVSQTLFTKYKEAVGDLFCPEENPNKNKAGKNSTVGMVPMANGTYFGLPSSDKSESASLSEWHSVLHQVFLELAHFQSITHALHSMTMDGTSGMS